MDQIYWAIFLQLSHKLTQLQKCGPKFVGHFHTFVSKVKQIQKCVAGHFCTCFESKASAKMRTKFYGPCFYTCLKNTPMYKYGPNYVGHFDAFVSNINQVQK